MIAAHYQPGQRFGRMTVIRREPKYKTLCLCDCGQQKVVNGRSLSGGHILSCGCLRKELRATKNLTHGQTNSRTYRIWSGIVTRCTNPNRREYKWYGGKGVQVCSKWMTFEGFLDDMGPAPVGMSIDRIDSSGHYELKNCRWATTSEQINNRSNTIRLTFEGQTKTLTQWAREIDVPYGTLKSRIRLGWPTERILGLHR
jgi:hypothetical protein